MPSTRVLLTVGSQQLLLPTDQGLPAILKALSGARRVKSDRRYDRTSPRVEVYAVNEPLGFGEVEVEAILVARHIKVVEAAFDPLSPAAPTPDGTTKAA